MRVGKVYFEKLLNYDIYDEISSYDNDVLIIHSDADSVDIAILLKKSRECLFICSIKSD